MKMKIMMNYKLSISALCVCLAQCIFAQDKVEYLGHTLSSEGIAKGSKVEAVLKY